MTFFNRFHEQFSSRIQAGRITRVVLLVGLPRSGTTLAAALLDAHSRCTTAYEPWNSGLASTENPALSIESLFRVLPLKLPLSEALINTLIPS